MSGSLQLGFCDYEQVYAKKKTRRQVFLDEMEATIPWDDFHALIRPVYHQPSAKGGRPPFPLEVMLRISLAAAVVHAVRSVDGGDSDRHPLFPVLCGN